jgi:hypothetical protein
LSLHLNKRHGRQSLLLSFPRSPHSAKWRLGDFPPIRSVFTLEVEKTSNADATITRLFIVINPNSIKSHFPSGCIFPAPRRFLFLLSTMRFLHISVATLLHLVANATAQAPPPTAKTLNGTYQGKYLTGWDQNVFLGLPYAQPPIGQLRYRWPQSINTSFSDIHDASTYGYSCMQYHTAFNISEDCLSLNVIRPSERNSTNQKQELLPVLVWIFGGGLYTGSTADPQYNLSGIVKVSQDMGKPIIAVSMNYRLNMYGFLQTPALLAEGSSNAGFLDQRMALRWIQENIQAFGGDPKRVVIWGESAGAQSIAYHLFSYDGRDDRLFRAAIMESNQPIPLSYNPSSLSHWSGGCFMLPARSRLFPP